MKLPVMKCLPVLCAFISLQLSAIVQPKKYTTANAHSHNDYEQSHPFTMAYSKRFGSIEADIFLLPGSDTLWVAHYAKDIEVKKRSLDELYLRPLENMIKRNRGDVYADKKLRLQLMIDLKTEAIPTLRQLIKTLERYKTLTTCNSLQIVISGNRPAIEDYSSYPAFILFDGKMEDVYPGEAGKRVVMMSANLKQYTTWDGKSSIPPADFKKIKSAVQKAHDAKKKVRFWNAPDTIDAWKSLMALGVDYINTDHINELTEYLKRTATGH